MKKIDRLEKEVTAKQDILEQVSSRKGTCALCTNSLSVCSAFQIDMGHELHNLTKVLQALLCCVTPPLHIVLYLLYYCTILLFFTLPPFPLPPPLQLRREKIDLENTLEQEQEMLVNKLWKKMDRVEAEKR